MTKEIRLSGGACHLAIAVLGYESAGARLASGDSWLRCEFSVAVGPFTGTYSASMTTDELEGLASDSLALVERLEGELSFKTMEPGLELRVGMGRRGNAIVEGRATSMDCLGTSLVFSFETDQTYLGAMSESAREAAAAYSRI